jgi:hypothetical protein
VEPPGKHTINLLPVCQSQTHMSPNKLFL